MENKSEITVKKDGRNWISSLLRNLMEFASSQFAWMKLDRLSVWNQPVSIPSPASALSGRRSYGDNVASMAWGARIKLPRRGATVIFKTEARGDHGRQRDPS